jgi:hypothetical protein
LSSSDSATTAEVDTYSCTGTAYDFNSLVVTHSQSLSDYITPLPSYAGTHAVYFNSTGSKLYVGFGSNGEERLWQFTLGTNYTLSTASLDGYKRTSSGVEHITPVSVGFYTNTNGYLRLFRHETADDIIYSMHSTTDNTVMERRGGRVYQYQTDTDSFRSRIYDDDTLETSYGYINTSLNIYSALDNNSQDIEAHIIEYDGLTSWVAKTLIIYGSAIYLRTHLDLPQEVVDSGGFAFTPVTSPDELTNFVYIEATNDTKPFDNKNYTIATAQTQMLYTLSGNKAFDTVALGHIKGEQITVVFKNSVGAVVTTITDTINTNRDVNGNLEAWHTTLIFYSDVIMEAGSTVEITIDGTNIELGTLLLGMSADAGFTNLTLKNDYKDFSVFEYDDFGNADYTERAKVSRYSGAVQIYIENYDMIDRLMTSLGKGLVIVNGSDSNSTSSETTTIFAATQKIGRFLSFSQKTVIKDDDMGRMAEYTFTLEEIV